MRALLAWFISCLVLATLAGAQTPDPAFRAVWINRWDYRSAADVKRAIEEIASLGATDVLWQVRGQADAFYKSDLEPWGRELLRDLPEGAKDPGYDPLALAVAEAHARGMRIHAWVNVMPMWKGMEIPPDPTHLFHTHPLWRLFDAKGVPQALNDHYIIVNPILPEVQDHIVAVCADIMSRYALDGLHLDYIRFVSETMKDATAYPADERSLALFKHATGRGGVATKEDQAAYLDYKRQRITDLVRRIKREAVARRAGAVLTAAVWRRPELGRETYLQDGVLWLREGTLERALPMIYQDDDAKFESDLRAWVEAVGPENLGRLSAGIANYKHAPEQTGVQVGIARRLGTPGYAVFAYASLFESVDPNQSKEPKEVRLRADRRQALTAFMKSSK